MSKVGDSIIRGLEQAVEYTQGRPGQAVTHRIARVPDEIDVKAVRARTGMSQPRFAASFGFAVESVRNWEQGRRKPDLAVRAFLKVIAHDPEAVRRALAE